ncbi:MAG TPA: Smr/MutS family protein [Burkholderiales bacterium]|nr:Smr/MutS family protein [Burkholderiales bacterium]
MPRQPSPPPDDDTLLAEALKDVAPLPDHGRVVLPARRTQPLPYQTWRDEREALAESLTCAAEWDVETDEDTAFLRPGLDRQVLRKLKRGHWVIQENLDLHGMNRMEARLCVATFLGECVTRGLRCVRIVHGKGLGSKHRLPVLKAKVRYWLTQRDEVLAFCDARQVDGGSGAVIALLKSGSRGKGQGSRETP